MKNTSKSHPSRRFRKASILLMLLLAVTLIAAACGSNNGNQDGKANGASNAASSNTGANSESGGTGNSESNSAGNAGGEQGGQPDEAAADAPRTIVHAMETTELVGTPERVVILTQEGTEALLELGVIPVGAVNSGLGDGWFPHIADQMQGVTELGDESQPNLELILSLQPDLIIGNKVRHEQIYAQLKEIAPTVFSSDLAGRWQENFDFYAQALNKVAEGEAAIAAYQVHVEEAKAKLGDKLSMEVSIVRFLPQAVRIYQKDTFAGVILQDLGFARPASQDVDNFMEVIEKERIEALDGDVMFHFNADYDEEKAGTKNQEAWMADPLFANLKVAQNNAVFKVDEVIWNLSGGIKSANLLIDQIVEYMDGL